jgi:hypothetical protein
MEIVKILGCDPSLRNTGLAIVEYNTETKQFKVDRCQVLSNPQKFTGKDAILNMLDMIKDTAYLYEDADTILVESPPVLFNQKWSQGTVSSIAHISGGAVALLGIDKAYLFRPTEWNKSRKKEVTFRNTVDILGDPDTWGYLTRIKSDKKLEHIMDAASMALFWIKHQYIEV